MTGFLMVETANDVVPPTFVELTGNATTSAYELTPLGLDFGERVIGSGPSPVQEFTIDPTGDGPVPFYGVELQGDNTTSFTITDLDDFPAMIPADSSTPSVSHSTRRASPGSLEPPRSRSSPTTTTAANIP